MVRGKRKSTKPKRRYGRRPKKMQIQRSLKGFPSSRIAKLRYVENQYRPFSYTAVGYAGVKHVQTFRANGCYDPNYTGSGHQPMGFDQWADFYNHYIVKGARITTKIMIDGGENITIAGCITLTDDAAGGAIPIEDIVERGNVTHRIMHYDANGSSNHGGVMTLTKNFSSKRFFSAKNLQDQVQRLGAPVGSDPAELAYFNIHLESMSAPAATVYVSLFTIIDYIVEFSEPKDLPTS